MARYSQHIGNGEYIHYGQKEHDNAVMAGVAFDLAIVAYKHKAETVSLVAFIVALTTPLLWVTLIQPPAAIILGIIALSMQSRTQAQTGQPVQKKFRVFAILGIVLPFACGLLLLLGIALVFLYQLIVVGAAAATGGLPAGY